MTDNNGGEDEEIEELMMCLDMLDECLEEDSEECWKSFEEACGEDEEELYDAVSPEALSDE